MSRIVATVILVFGGWLVMRLATHTAILPDPLAADRTGTTPIVQILARDGSLLAERGRPHDYIPLEMLPDHVVGAVLATEDRKFYEHWGFDPAGLARAALSNLRAGKMVQGGSTITQQLAKNLYLSQERTFGRKLDELALALWLELKFSKRQILELYLNQVYFGAGAYGIEAAAQRYFGKSARALSVREAALVAGLLQAPSRYSPYRNPELAAERSATVIAKMERSGVIDAATVKRALGERLQLRDEQESDVGDAALGYAIALVLDSMPPLPPAAEGLVIVETTIDAGVQRVAQRTLARELGRHGATANSDQGAVVVVDGEGSLVAVVGGRSFRDSQFNRATRALRQPGSAFKPFVYLAALERGFTPDTIVYDLPISVGTWAPRNAGGRYKGAVTLRDGLAGSVNTVAVRLQQQIGAEAVVDVARRLGITTAIRADASLPLGTSEVLPVELATAYVPFVNGGTAVEPYVIRRVRTPAGRVLYAHSGSRRGVVLTPERVAQMNDMLSAVVSDGTGRRARLTGHPVAGKTGTTQDGRDAWFVGYTRQLAAAVWIGRDGRDGEPGLWSGGDLPADVWREVMTEAHRNRPSQPLFGLEAQTPPVGPPAAIMAVVAPARTRDAADGSVRTERAERPLQAVVPPDGSAGEPAQTEGAPGRATHRQTDRDMLTDLFVAAGREPTAPSSEPEVRGAPPVGGSVMMGLGGPVRSAKP